MVDAEVGVNLVHKADGGCRGSNDGQLDSAGE